MILASELVACCNVCQKLPRQVFAVCAYVVRLVAALNWGRTAGIGIITTQGSRGSEQRESEDEGSDELEHFGLRKAAKVN